MSFRVYIKSKLIALLYCVMLSIYLFIIMLFADVDPGFILLLFSGEFTVAIVWFFTGWHVVNKRLKDIQNMLAGLQDKYLLGELLERPVSPIEEKYFYIMRQISSSAIGAVKKEQREKQEYYDYVEGWVHEIKTPLTACSLILANGGDERRLRQELKRADNITESILYYARLRSTEKDLQISNISVRKVIDRAVHDEMELLIASGISIVVEGDFIAPTDAKLFEFILKQLFINCVKYCKGCQIKIVADEGAVIVEDNGPGIPAHELSRVTDRGFTGEQWRNSGSSTGMGLYIVSQLCHQLNIGYNIQSRKGEYTRITLTFRSLTKL